MRCQRPVGSDDGPSIAKRSGFLAARGQHWLNREREAGSHDEASIRRASIWHMRILVHFSANAVSAVVAYNGSASGSSQRLHRMTNTSQAVASRGGCDRTIEGIFSIAKQPRGI